MNEIIRINNWNLNKGSNGEEPTIQDLELATKLGYAAPATIRRLIRRMAEAGQLGVISTVEITSTAKGGRTGLEFFLNEAQALKVISRSKTKIANQILDEIIEVYLAYRRGLLAPPPPESASMQIAALAASVAQLTSVVASLAAFVQSQTQQPAQLPTAPRPSLQRRLPLAPPEDDASKWFFASEVAARLNISVSDVFFHAREIGVDGSKYERRQRQRNGRLAIQFHQWAANEIAARVNQLRRPQG